jgi:hypothetical protein
MRHMVFALALTMTLVSAAVAGPFEDGVRALKGGDYATPGLRGSSHGVDFIVFASAATRWRVDTA